MGSIEKRNPVGQKRENQFFWKYDKSIIPQVDCLFQFQWEENDVLKN